MTPVGDEEFRIFLLRLKPHELLVIDDELGKDLLNKSALLVKLARRKLPADIPQIGPEFHGVGRRRGGLGGGDRQTQRLRLAPATCVIDLFSDVEASPPFEFLAQSAKVIWLSGLPYRYGIKYPFGIWMPSM